MSGAISGKEWGVGDLFGKEFVFRIPTYQRPYAWETQQAGELFDDLDTALGEVLPKKLEQAPPYFLGSIVVIKSDGNPDAEVVDGQQRLTTLTLLLSALRAEIEDPDMRSELRALIYEPENKLHRTPARYRLSLRERDAEFFRTRIQNDGGLDTLKDVNDGALKDSQRNLARNAKVLRDRVHALTLERRVLLAQYLVARSFLVVVSTPTFESAYRIFSVLNDRGMDLSHADVLKADVLGGIPREDERETYAAKWEQVEEDLGRDAFRDLISHVRTIFVRKKVERSVLAEVRDLIKPASRPKWFLDDVIFPYADALDVIRTASYQSTGDASKVNGLLRWLDRIDNVDWVPPALVIVSTWQAAPDELERALLALERLASLLMVGRADVNDRINRYAGVLQTLTAGKDIEATCTAMAPTADDLRRAREIVDGELYLNAKVRAYVLLRVDAALAASRVPNVQETITVEHVLPQTPLAGSQWLVWWPDDAVRASWLHRLGNLLLLSRRKNSQAQNFELDVKKAKYFSAKGGVSSFPLTTQVLQETEWTPAVVARRQAALLALLEATWTG